MKALVVGGRLQGAEIAYLAHEAGWEVTLVDRESSVLASCLCDTFVHDDVARWKPERFAEFDLVVPATENLATLQAVDRLCATAGVPFAFDEMPFRVSASKAATNLFLSQIGVPIPPSIQDEAQWPHGYVVKPDSESGSHGVVRFQKREEAAVYLMDHDRHVGQVFVEGPIYSIEVVCNGSSVAPHSVTEVVVGEDFDCYRIVAPARIAPQNERWIQLIAHRIGLALNMRGIFDIEIAWCDEAPYVLEIDARMPSQTPIAVYHATGVNFVVELARCFTEVPESPERPACDHAGGAVLEHICIEGADYGTAIAEGDAGSQASDLVERGLAHYVGESQLATSGPYLRSDGFLGADAALVTQDAIHNKFYATLIYR